jgi:serine/threonine-protein kinase HipA
MIKTNYGWSLSPAYDLLNVAIVNPEDKEELALTIAGKKKKITKENLIDFGSTLSLSNKQISSVFKRFQKNKKQSLLMIENSFLSEEMKIRYIDLLLKRYDKI